MQNQSLLLALCSLLKIPYLHPMCYSNSSTSTNIQLAQRYKKKIPETLDAEPVFYASGFTYPKWRIITSAEEIASMHWGLVPNWFSGADWKEIASITLNSRIETADEKASFRHLIDRQRCIVPSTGFFEWKHLGKEKVPYFIYPKTDTVFSMAGLFDKWIDPVKGETIQSFTILTCEANPLMREIHNTKFRMPVILPDELENEWLSGKLDHRKLEIPASQEMMAAHEISKKIISSPQANSAGLLKPFDNGIYEQGSLF